MLMWHALRLTGLIEPVISHLTQTCDAAGYVTDMTPTSKGCDYGDDFKKDTRAKSVIIKSSV